MTWKQREPATLEKLLMAEASAPSAAPGDERRAAVRYRFSSTAAQQPAAVADQC